MTQDKTNISYTELYALPDDSDAQTPIARVTAVHRERFSVVSRYGEGFARLKTTAYLFEELAYRR